MITLIAWKDFKEFTRDGRLYWAGGVVAILFFAALAVGWQRQREIASERAVAQTLDYDSWVHQAKRHPHDAAHQGMHVFKPEPPLSIFDPGIDPYVGSSIWLQAHRESELKFRPAQDATGLQRLGNLSGAWVLQVLGPLLVIILGFNAFAGERERGTLRQTLSLGVSYRQLLWGKALALAFSLTVLLAPGLLVAAVTVAFGAVGGAPGGAFLRIGILAAGYAVYLGTAIFVVLAVSAKAPSSRVSLVTLLGLWIAVAILAPRITADLSRLWYPSPSRSEFDTVLDSDLKSAYRNAWIENFNVATRWGAELPLDKWGIALRVDDHAGYGVMDRHFEELWDTFARQQRAQEWAGIVAPILSVQAFSMAVAGTDFAHHRDFSEAAEQQRRLIQDRMSDDLVEHADPLGGKHFTYQAGADLWKSIPEFHYQTPSVVWALYQCWRSLATLCAGFCLALAAAYAAISRRSV